MKTKKMLNGCYFSSCNACAFIVDLDNQINNMIFNRSRSNNVIFRMNNVFELFLKEQFFRQR